MVGKREATVYNQDSRMRGDQHRGCEAEWKSEREREIERETEREREEEREGERGDNERGSYL